MSPSTSGVIDTKEISREIIKQLKSLSLTPESKPEATQVAGINEKPYNYYPSSSPYQSKHEPKEESQSIREIISEEFRRELRGSMNPNQGRGESSGFSNPGSFGRGGRTKTGIIICTYCGKKGHSMYNCRFLQEQNESRQFQNRSRQRDTRNQKQTFDARNSSRKNQGQPGQGN